MPRMLKIFCGIGWWRGGSSSSSSSASSVLVGSSGEFKEISPKCLVGSIGEDVLDRENTCSVSNSLCVRGRPKVSWNVLVLVLCSDELDCSLVVRLSGMCDTGGVISC